MSFTNRLMLLQDRINTLNWPQEHILTERQEAEVILADLFGSFNDANMDSVFMDFVSEVDLALDWETVGDELAALVVQCENELTEAVREAYGPFGNEDKGFFDEESDTIEETPDHDNEDEEAFLPVYGGGQPVSEPPMF